MTTRDEPIFDKARWLHENQGTDEDDYLPEPLTRKTKTEERRLADLEARQQQGDRQDWRKHLYPLPAGYRLADEKSLTQPQKAKRTKSIKTAMEKRGKRKRFTWNSDQGQKWAARNRGSRPQPEKNRMGHFGGTYPSEIYPHTYPEEEAALTLLCEEIVLFLTDRDPGVKGAIELKRESRERRGEPGHYCTTLERLFKEHVSPHGEYQWWA